jgi:hypothetical protein
LRASGRRIRVTVDEHLGCHEAVSSARGINLHGLDRSTTVGATIEIGDGRRNGPIRTHWKGCGGVKRLGNVDFATGIGRARVLNVIACPLAINTQSGVDKSMGINRSREIKKEGVNDERLGDHREYKGG